MKQTSGRQKKGIEAVTIEMARVKLNVLKGKTIY